MPAATMFSKFKSGNQQNQANPIDANPITQVSIHYTFNIMHWFYQHQIRMHFNQYLNVSYIQNFVYLKYFEIGKPVACCGPELIWKIHDAYRKNDGKVNKNLNYLSFCISFPIFKSKLIFFASCRPHNKLGCARFPFVNFPGVFLSISSLPFLCVVLRLVADFFCARLEQHH